MFDFASKHLLSFWIMAIFEIHTHIYTHPYTHRSMINKLKMFFDEQLNFNLKQIQLPNWYI